MISILNHVAILVESIESFVDKQGFTADLLGTIEEFPGEGTRELYIGRKKQMGKLLLMQAIGDGPYKEALKKRGTGLHHIAIDVLDIPQFVDKLSGSGWSLHTTSLHSYKHSNTVYLCRAGEPVIIEVHQVKKHLDENYFIEKVQFPFSQERLQAALKCDQIESGKVFQVLLAEGAILNKL